MATSNKAVDEVRRLAGQLADRIRSLSDDDIPPGLGSGAMDELLRAILDPGQLRKRKIVDLLTLRRP